MAGRSDNTGREAGDMTRYLCAAVYLDSRYRHDVLQALLADDFKALAPSPGVHLPTLLHHAMAAQKYRNAADAWMTAVVLLSPFTKGISLFLIPLVITAGYLHRQIHILSTVLSIRRFQPIDPFAWHGSALLKNRLIALEEIEEGNVLVYSHEGFHPFAGSGVDAGGWSLVADTSKSPAGEPDKHPLPFTQEELYYALETELQTLNLPGLRVKERVFVPGQEIREDSRFMASPYQRPNLNLGRDALEEIKTSNKTACRYYKQAEIVMGKGEIVFSVFFRIVRFKRHLFLEVQQQLLPPLKKRFYDIDRHTAFWTPGKMMQAFFKIAAQSIFRPFLAPFFLLSQLFQRVDLYQARKNAKTRIRENARYDYGAVRSLRERAADDRYALYIQKTDREMYGKLLQHLLMDSFVEFLRQHHIDVSSVVENAVFILNQQSPMMDEDARIHASVGTGGGSPAPMIAKSDFEAALLKASGAARQALAHATGSV